MAIAAVFDSMNYIHATTLRWTLFWEGRLRYTSTLRLFSSSNAHGPHAWYMNVISAISLATVYGGISILTTSIDITGKWDGNTAGNIEQFSDKAQRHGIDFSAWAMLTLGTGLLLQTCISTYCLLCSGNVAYWGSNPLVTAKTYARLTLLNTERTKIPSGVQAVMDRDAKSYEGRYTKPTYQIDAEGSTGDESRNEDAVARPNSQQPSLRTIVPQTHCIMLFVWLSFIASAVTSTVLVALVSTHSLGGFDDNLSSNTLVDKWKNYAYISTRLSEVFGNRTEWLGISFQIISQSILTFCLHSVQLLVNLFRDEAAWRKAAHVGSSLSGDSLWSFLTSSQSMLFFFYRSLIQWIFGCAFTADIEIGLALLPMLTLSIMLFVLSCILEYSTRKSIKGFQPVTYGKISRLLDFVDDWDHERIFWGDKGEMENGVRKAGTASYRLADLQPDASYVGIVSNSPTHEI